MPPSLVVFDLDGTLVDTAQDLADSLIRVVRRELGQERSPEQVITAVGWGARNLVRTVLGPAYEARTDEILAAFRADYRANLVVATRPYPGVPALLEALQERGVRQAVLTNKPGALSRELVRQLELDRRFEAVWGPEDVPRKKPAPEALWALLDHLQVRREDALMVGDMETDIDSARAAGVRSVLLTVSEFRRPPGLAARADAVVATVEELRALLLA